MRVFATIFVGLLAYASTVVALDTLNDALVGRSYGVRPSPRPYPPPPPPPKFESCGGFRIEPKNCAEGYICVDNPYVDGCGMACDMPGICVKPTFCGGFAGIQCEGSKKCIDDPRDDCDPESGGADCGGICV